MALRERSPGRRGRRPRRRPARAAAVRAHRHGRGRADHFLRRRRRACPAAAGRAGGARPARPVRGLAPVDEDIGLVVAPRGRLPSALTVTVDGGRITSYRRRCGGSSGGARPASAGSAHRLRHGDGGDRARPGCLPDHGVAAAVLPAGQQRAEAVVVLGEDAGCGQGALARPDAGRPCRCRCAWPGLLPGHGEFQHPLDRVAGLEGDLVGGDGEAEGGQPVEEGAQGDLQLGAGQVLAEALVDAEAERDVVAGGAVPVQACPGRRRRPRRG